MQSLLPELGAAGQQHQAKTVVVGQLRPFDLALEDNELLTEHGILGDAIRLAAVHIGQRGWSTPLLDPAAKVFADIEKVCEHAEMRSQYPVDFSV